MEFGNKHIDFLDYCRSVSLVQEFFFFKIRSSEIIGWFFYWFLKRLFSCWLYLIKKIHLLCHEKIYFISFCNSQVNKQKMYALMGFDCLGDRSPLGSDWCFNILSGSYLQGLPKMTSTQNVETSVTNNSPSKDSFRLDDQIPSKKSNWLENCTGIHAINNKLVDRPCCL